MRFSFSRLLAIASLVAAGSLASATAATPAEPRTFDLTQLTAADA
jgi:hypothetical protein